MHGTREHVVEPARICRAHSVEVNTTSGTNVNVVEHHLLAPTPTLERMSGIASPTRRAGRCKGVAVGGAERHKVAWVNPDAGRGFSDHACGSRMRGSDKGPSLRGACRALDARSDPARPAGPGHSGMETSTHIGDGGELSPAKASATPTRLRRRLLRLRLVVVVSIVVVLALVVVVVALGNRQRRNKQGQR